MFNNKMFIEAMNASFRAVDCKLTVDDTIFLADDIVTLNPYYSGSLLSSVMRCCQVELNMDSEIDYSFAENLKGKMITNVQTAAKNNMLGRQFYPLFENKAYIGHGGSWSQEIIYSWEYSSFMLTTQFEYGVDVTVRVDNDYYYMYVFKIEGDEDVPLSDSYSTVTIPANTPCYISLIRADSMDIEPTEAANIVFDAGFTYRNYGEYKIYDSKYVEENNSLQLTCYDRMLDSAVPYDLEIDNDTTVRAYLTAICERLGWELSNDPFANENGVITVEAVKSYLPEVIESEDEDENGETQTTTEIIDSSATFRDVLDDIAELVGGNLLFPHGNNVLCVVYPQPAVIDDELAVLDIDSQESIHFYETFGPINKVAIIDSEAGDAVTLQDSSSIDANGECCINIVDNPLLNANRESFVGNIFAKLNNISYVCYDFISKCYGYLDFGDIVNIEDRKGNLKRSIILNDSTIFGTAVSESCSAERYSADAETDYSVAEPLDKVKKTVKKLMSQSTELSERVAEATATIAKTIDGHAQLVDLEYNSSTQTYYIGNGKADTLVVSENPAVATETEPNNWQTGRVVKINYNGFAVSTTGIAGPYSDFAVYYDKTKNKYLVNADDIAVGTLTGIAIDILEGKIANWKIGAGRLYDDSNNGGWAGLNSYGLGAAFYAGGNDVSGNASAFKVYHDGSLYATNANIEGYIKATSGEFTGNIYSQYGDIGGWGISPYGIGKTIYHWENESSAHEYRVSLASVDTNGTPAIYVMKRKFVGNSWIDDYCTFFVNWDGTLTVADSIYMTDTSRRNQQIEVLSFAHNILTIPTRVNLDGGWYSQSNTIYCYYSSANGYDVIGSVSGADGAIGTTATYFDKGTAKKWNEVSDKKLKNHIEYLSDNDKFKDFIMRLKPVAFSFKNGSRKRLGFYAQEVASACQKTIGDCAIYEASEINPVTKEEKPYSEDSKEENLVWTLDYNEFAAPIIAMLQSQQKKIDELTKRIEVLENENN